MLTALDDEAAIQTNERKQCQVGWPDWLEMPGFDFVLPCIGGNENRWFVKPTFKLDEEAGMQQISSPRVPAKLCKERGNYEKLVCRNAGQVG